MGDTPSIPRSQHLCYLQLQHPPIDRRNGWQKTYQQPRGSSGRGPGRSGHAPSWSSTPTGSSGGCQRKDREWEGSIDFWRRLRTRTLLRWIYWRWDVDWRGGWLGVCLSSYSLHIGRYSSCGKGQSSWLFGAGFQLHWGPT